MMISLHPNRLFYLLIFLPGLFFDSECFAQKQTLDDFSALADWKIVASQTAQIDTMRAAGFSGSALQINFNFSGGSGYCGVQKQIALDLPENYRFTFYLKAEAPANNLEFKILDASGDNVWWNIQRNAEFPTQWQKVVIKKRHISFAWGPAVDHTLRHADKIEFMLSSSGGGQGSVFFDQFSFEKLDNPNTSAYSPIAFSLKQSKTDAPLPACVDGNLTTPERIREGDGLLLDLQKYREFGGLVIDWDRKDFAQRYQVQTSNDLQEWETIYSVNAGKAGRAYLNLRESEARYIRLNLSKSSRGKGCVIKEIQVKDYSFSDSPESFFSAMARDNKRGLYPRYLLGEQSYWTIVGVSGDYREALINEEGAVEIDKQSFSIEPFLKIDDRLYTWNDVQLEQSLEKNCLPIPAVTWKTERFQLDIKVFADGKPDSSALYITYTLQNNGGKALNGNLFLAIRPLQVNPPWQFLNFPGGTSKIQALRFSEKSRLTINNKHYLTVLPEPKSVAALEFDQGDVTGYFGNAPLPDQSQADDQFGYASAAMRFPDFNLSPCESLSWTVVSAYPEELSLKMKPVAPASVREAFDRSVKFWETALGKTGIKLPPSAQRLSNSIKSNLAYVLINRDYAGIQPGSRSYERSWIRDGALTSSALLRFGLKEEVRDFLDWFSRYQFASGMVPCVVDRRGGDPVLENDSNGEFIYALWQYYLFSGDSLFLRQKFNHVIKAAEFIKSMTDQRSTPKFHEGNDSLRAFYGLVTESISHEGYSAKPMHSYWDNFFTLRGLKDAVNIACLLNEKEYEKIFSAQRDTFSRNLMASIRQTIVYKNIDYIPGCAELGDFDATSTAIAVYPCCNPEELPQPYLQNTFDRYFQYFSQRKKPEFLWINYTPYEVRLIGTFIRLNQPQRAHELLKYFFSDQRPQGWNHWAEVVWKDLRQPAFIGDMPHGWVGSDFLSAARSMFVYEDETDQSLTLGAGLLAEWLNDPQGVAISQLPTWYGKVSYRIHRQANQILIELDGAETVPPGGLRFRVPDGLQYTAISLNSMSVEKDSHHFISFNKLPATIIINLNK
jgi:hypothetical protein